MIKHWIHLEKCAACDRPIAGHERAKDLSDPFRISEEHFTVIQCKGCNTWLLNPRPAPAEMQRFYQSDFLFTPPEPGASALTLVAGKIQAALLAPEVQLMCDHLPGHGRYLDYSAGNGQMLASVMARRPDTSPHATEFSEPYREMIAARVPSANLANDIDGFPQGLRFHLISAHGALEHVEDPLLLLQKLRARLEPGGMAFVSVPNPESLQARLFGRRWGGWLAPRHFHLLPRPALIQLARKAGFRVESEVHFFLRTAPGMAALSVFPGLNPLNGLKFLVYGPLFFVFLPVEWLLSKFRVSGFMGFVLAAE